MLLAPPEVPLLSQGMASVSSQMRRACALVLNLPELNQLANQVLNLHRLVSLVGDGLGKACLELQVLDMLGLCIVTEFVQHL